MYSKEFCKIYDEDGWDYFSITMGKSILKYFDMKQKKINTHLDLACGPGTLCNLFFDYHIKTVGVDISKDMIEIAKCKNKEINFTVDDMVDYSSNEKFDLVTITCDAVNHILEEEKIQRLFLNVYKMLNGESYFVFDILDKSKLCFDQDIITNRDNGVKAIFKYSSKNNSCVNSSVKIIENNELKYEYSIIERLYDVGFIKSILEMCGFKILKIDNKILEEEQRFQDKLYFICKKEISIK